jgi:hypothetical protein
MKQKRVKAEFTITDLSKGLSMSDIQNAALSLFSTPMRFPKESAKFMTLEEFILDKGEEDER